MVVEFYQNSWNYRNISALHQDVLLAERLVSFHTKKLIVSFMYTFSPMSVHRECLRSSLAIAVKTVNTGLGFNSSLTSGTLLWSWGCGFSYKSRKIKIQKLKEDTNRTLISVSGILWHVSKCFLLSEVACVPMHTATNVFSLQSLLHTHGSSSISYSCDPLEMI